MFSGTDNTLQNIPQIQTECGNILYNNVSLVEEYFAKYCQSHRTLLEI